MPSRSQLEFSPKGLLAVQVALATDVRLNLSPPGLGKNGGCCHDVVVVCDRRGNCLPLGGLEPDCHPTHVNSVGSVIAGFGVAGTLGGFVIGALLWFIAGLF